jgi:hypothetical protein
MSGNLLRDDDEQEVNFQFDFSSFDNLAQDPLQLMKEATADVAKKYLKIESLFFQQFNYSYFSDTTDTSILSVECDVIESSKNKIIVESYLYHNVDSKFIAKSFAVLLVNKED